MSDTQQENITERMDNALFYFRELVFNSQTVQTYHFLHARASNILSEMERLNAQIKKHNPKP